jgi:hypothetical protein
VAVSARGLCVQRMCGGVATADSPAMGPRRGLHREHGEGSGVALTKVAEGGAHSGRLSIVRWRFTVWRWRFVDGKPTRWLKAEVEGSCITRRLRGGVGHGKSGETRAHGSAH